MGQKKPCRNALLARALDPMREPHMPACIFANSSSPSSQGMHFNFTPFDLFLYRTSSTNWYKVDRRTTFSASSCSSGSSPVWRKRTVCCSHAGAWGSTARTKGISSAMGAAVSTARASRPAGAGFPLAGSESAQHSHRRPLGARQESTCRGSISSACFAPYTVRRMVELAEAKRYLVPQVA